MNKKVNISDIKHKMHFIYKDEREKNVAAIVIYNKDGKFFFDPDYKNKMSNLEVEALLLRGALVDRGGKYYRPSSFNENNVSFSDAVINPEDIEVDLSGYVTKDELNAKADINDIPTKLSDLQNDSNFLTSIPSEYVTDTELNNKGYLTQHQSLDNYATKSYVDSEIAKAQLEGGEVDLDPYDIKNKITLDPPEIKHIAHRGYSSLAPENTLPAYEQAALYGFWGAEADIQETSDGYFILMHDDTVDRTTNGSGKVAEMSLSQIQSLTVDAGSNIAKYPSLKVPTFEEFLICCKTNGLVPVIEIKHINNMDGFLDILQKHNMIDHSIVISFDVDTLIELREYSPDIRIQTLTINSIDDLKMYNFDVDVHASVDTLDTISSLTETAHSQGLKVNCWTVNDVNLLEQLTDIGVDFITTDELFSNNMKRYNKVLECEKEIDALKKELQALKDLLSSTPDLPDTPDSPDSPGLSYAINGFAPTAADFSAKFPDSRPILEVGNATKFRSTCEIAKLTDKFKLSFDDSKYRMAVHMFDESGNFIFDSEYLRSDKEVICPPPNSEVFNTIIYGQLTSGDVITQEHLDSLNNSNITLNFISAEEYNILNTEYYADGYSLSVDDFEYASTVNANYSYPSMFMASKNPTHRAGCTTKIFKANKVKITFDANYNVTLIPLTSRGYRIKDMGWSTSGETYDMTTNGISGCEAFTLYIGTKTGNFDDTTLAELVNSIVIEDVE